MQKLDLNLNEYIKNDSRQLSEESLVEYLYISYQLYIVKQYCAINMGTIKLLNFEDFYINSGNENVRSSNFKANILNKEITEPQLFFNEDFDQQKNK